MLWPITYRHPQQMFGITITLDRDFRGRTVDFAQGRLM